MGSTLGEGAGATGITRRSLDALARFHRYWRWARFGIVAIRYLLLPAVRRTAEARWAAERPVKR